MAKKMTAGNWVFVSLLLGVVLPILFATLIFWIASPAFVPTLKLKWLSNAVSPFFALLFLVVTLVQTRKKIARYFSTGSGHGIKALAITLFAPVMGYFLWQGFVSGPLSYTLHRVEGSAPSTRAENVNSAGYGHRGCHWSAALTGDTFLFHREVCGLSRSDGLLLLKGGNIILQGNSSSYGFTYNRYAVVRGER